MNPKHQTGGWLTPRGQVTISHTGPLSYSRVTLVSGAKDSSVRFWDTAKFRGAQTCTTLPERVRDWCFGPDGKSIYATAIAERKSPAPLNGADLRLLQPETRYC